MKLGEEDVVDLQLTISMRLSSYEVLEQIAANCGVGLGVLLSGLVEGATESVGEGYR